MLDFVGNSGRHKLVSTADILGGNYDDKIVEAARSSAIKKSKRGEASDMLEEMSRARQEEEEAAKRRRAAIKPAANYKTQTIDPFDRFGIVPTREPGYHRGRKPSDAMAAFLKGRGVEPSKLSWWQAGQLIGELKKVRPFSDRQIFRLEQAGYSADIPQEKGKKVIDLLAKAGWKRTPESDAAYKEFNPNQSYG